MRRHHRLEDPERIQGLDQGLPQSVALRQAVATPNFTPQMFLMFYLVQFTSRLGWINLEHGARSTINEKFVDHRKDPLISRCRDFDVVQTRTSLVDNHRVPYAHAHTGAARKRSDGGGQGIRGPYLPDAAEALQLAELN